MGIISKPVNLSTEANLLYEIYKTLSRIHIVGGSGGGGVQTVTGTLVDNTDPLNPIINTPSFAQTLAIDNKTNDIPIISNNGSASINVNDDYVSLTYGSQSFAMTDDDVQLYSDVPVSFDSNVSTDFNTPVLNYNSEEVATQPWVTSQLNIPFEIQIKQTTNDEPLIILPGSIKGNRGATITPSLVVNGIYRLTASTDIFKDIKDCYKRTDYYDVNILNFAGYSAIFTWFWYYIDDYTLEVVVTDGLGGDPVAEFLTDYVLLKAEYKD